MTNHRTTCPYCKTDVLNRDIGSHLLKKHITEVFTEKTNLRALHNDMNLRRPVQLDIKELPFYFCFADNSCIKKESLADTHFKGRADAHREAILKLRESFPLSGQPTTQTSDAPIVEPQSVKSVPPEPFFTEKEKKTLQDFLAQCLLVENIGLSGKEKKLFEKLGAIVDSEKLKEEYPHLCEEKKEEHEEPEAEPLAEDQEVLPLTLPKPMTKQEAFNHIMTAKDIKAMTTSIATGKTIEVPEIKAFQGKSSIPRPTDLQLMQASRPVKQETAVKLIQVTKRAPKQAEG